MNRDSSPQSISRSPWTLAAYLESLSQPAPFNQAETQALDPLSPGLEFSPRTISLATCGLDHGPHTSTPHKCWPGNWGLHRGRGAGVKWEVKRATGPRSLIPHCMAQGSGPGCGKTAPCPAGDLLPCCPPGWASSSGLVPLPQRLPGSFQGVAATWARNLWTATLAVCCLFCCHPPGSLCGAATDPQCYPHAS